MADATTYDVSIGSSNFFIAASQDKPYIRQTAPYRKDQSDNTNEAGEQSLSSWWYRSQSSFHLGAGINYFEPSQDPLLKYRFYNSQNVDVWTPGEIRPLNSVVAGHSRTSGTTRSFLQAVTGSSGSYYVMSHDGYDVDLIDSAGNAAVHFIDYNSGTSEPVYAICNDGTYAYYVTNAPVGGVTKWHMFKKMIGAGFTEVLMVQANGAATNGRTYMRFVKDRIVLCVNNTISVLTTDATSAPTPVYTSTSFETTFNSVAASPSAIFVGAANKTSSFIMKLTQDATTLAFTGATVAAEMPAGEYITTLEYYLGYLIIGTNKGLRVAQTSSSGELVYGPLIYDQYIWQIACRENFIWAATSVNFFFTSGTQIAESSKSYPGLIRVDLSTQIEPLRFPWANDLNSLGSESGPATGVSFFGSSDQLCFTTANFHYVETTTPATQCYLLTGKVRFGTLENKIFLSVKDSAVYIGSSTVTLQMAKSTYNPISNINYWDMSSIFSGGSSTGNKDHPTANSSAISEMQLLIKLNPSGSNVPVFRGYQIKALPASPRQRLIQYPLYCYDNEMDKFNNRYGYTGRAYAILSALESTENVGEVVQVVDRRTSETFSAMIEEVTFKSETPPDKRFNGFGGILTVTVRKL